MTLKMKYKLCDYYPSPCIHPIRKGPGAGMVEKGLLLPITLIHLGFILLYKK